MSKTFILNIGGFDPSNGAGISADVKTFAAYHHYALSVQTALTIQNEAELTKVYWSSLDLIKEQIHILSKKYTWEYVKISLTNGLQMALEIIDEVLKISNSKIIWDPIMKASAGFQFYRGINQDILHQILDKIYLATPNWEEISKWDEGVKPLTLASKKSKQCHIYLKGGHHPQTKGLDYLFFNSGKIEKFEPQTVSQESKHGSGCFFSSSLTSYLAAGIELKQACKQAKKDTLTFLNSEKGLLGNQFTVFRPDRFQAKNIVANSNVSEKTIDLDVDQNYSNPVRSQNDISEVGTRFFHIYNRGNNKELVFYEKENYIYFIKLMKKYIAKSFKIYAFCLLDNHYHLIIGIREGKMDDFSQAMSNLMNAYTKAFNIKYDRTGSLFQRTFKRKLLGDNNYLLNSIIYVHTNSKHHKVQKNFAAYPYSSYKFILENNEDNSFIYKSGCLDLFNGLTQFIITHREKSEVLNHVDFE